MSTIAVASGELARAMETAPESVRADVALLLVEDDEVFRERLARALAARGFAVTAVGSLAAALAEVAQAPEYAVVDLRLAGSASGLDVVRALKEADALTRVVMLTAYGTIPKAIEATKLGVVGYVSKPADADEVVRA